MGAHDKEAVDKVGARVCDPQQAVPRSAAFGAIRSFFCRSQCCGSQTRAPILTLSTALTREIGIFDKDWRQSWPTKLMVGTCVNYSDSQTQSPSSSSKRLLP